MCDSFLLNFTSNFLANLLAGIIIGIVFSFILTWWMSENLSESARSKQRIDEKKADIAKAIHYLEFLNNETKNLVAILPERIHAFEGTGWGREIPIPTPYWEVLKPSGELPKLLRAEVLSFLTQFYDQIAYAKRGIDLVINCWLVSNPESVPGLNEKMQAFLNVTSSGLKGAQSLGANLQSQIDSEIANLKANLESL